MSRRGPGAAATLAAVAIAALTVTGCGANDNGGVITPPNTTTTAPGTRS